ncbi:MAG TPA: hypothetical protein VGH77_05335 [Streptosporangiaceae bacterium]
MTFADAVDARPDPAWDLMMDAKAAPFCSRATRCATGVFALKNFSQLVVMLAAADPLADALAEVAGADVAGVDALGDELALELLLLLPQAAMPTPSTPTSTTSWSVR